MITRLQRILIAASYEQQAIPTGYTAIFSFKQWFDYSGFCVRLKRVSDNAQQDFGFVGGYLDVAGIQTWANGSEVRCVKWYSQVGMLFATPYGTVQPPKLIIVNGEAIIKTAVGDGLRIDNIQHENVKVTSAWKHEGTHFNIVGCYNSTLSRMQFYKYNTQWILGVNTAYVFRSATAQSLISRHVVTYNSDDLNGQTSIHNQDGVSFTNAGNPTQTVFKLGVGVSDLNGYQSVPGEIYGIVIYHENELVADVEQTFIADYL